jgi:hypothetical protein
MKPTCQVSADDQKTRPSHFREAHGIINTTTTTTTSKDLSLNFNKNKNLRKNP